MAATLSIRDYLDHFLFSRDREIALEDRNRVAGSNGSEKPSSPVRRIADGIFPSPSQVKTFHPPQQNYGLMLAHVYEVVDGDELLIYSKRIAGHKSMGAFGIFVQDMIGSKMLKESQIMDGRMSRGSSLSDVSCISVVDVKEGHLRPGTTITVKLISSRSPSNIGSTELMGMLDWCQRNKIRVSLNLKFAHAFTWDNKYNRKGLGNLHLKGVKISSLSFSQILQSLLDDIKEDLESLDGLQTCRGVVVVDVGRIERALSILRQSVTIASDSYHRDQQKQLAEIVGHKSKLLQLKKFSQSELPAGLSLEAYRECILLQNTEMEWGKIRVGVAKITNGVSKEEMVFEKILLISDKATPKFQNNSNKNNDLDMNFIWGKVGSKVTMADLSRSEQIVVTVCALISEYNGHAGWVDEIVRLHDFLRDKAEESEIYKIFAQVRVETTVRYAHSVDGPIPVASNGSVNGAGQMMGFPRGMAVECIHIRDILFEMLEDLEDSVRHLGGLEYERGENLSVQGDGVESAMGEFNRAIKVRTQAGEFSMNDDFEDGYALDLNRI